MRSAKQEIAAKRLPHIQGIRALCLVYVLLFHFEIGGAQLGFLGVDMFFVISGYVMTNAICKKLFRDEFSMKQFIVSRYWRLCPTLFMTCALTLLFFYQILEPVQFLEVEWAALSSVLGVQNIREMVKQEDYFATPSKAKPLLHVWSLSLEQQFYGVYSVGLVVLHRFVRNTRYPRECLSALVVLTSALFLVFGTLLIDYYPSCNFYFLFHRFYEFGLGCTLFLLRAPNLEAENTFLVARFQSPKFLKEIFVCSALLVPTIQVFNLLPKHELLQLRIWSLLSVCILIDCPESHISSLLLSNRVAVAIGEASYTVYLLHLPIWVWLSSIFSCARFQQLRLSFVLLSLIASSLFMFWCIEKPFRSKKGPPFGGFSVACVLLFIAVFWHASSQNSGGEFHFDSKRVGDLVFDWRTGHDELFPVPDTITRKDRLSQLVYENGELVTQNPNAFNTNAMVIGNSFGLHTADGMRIASGKWGKKIIFETMLGCSFDLPGRGKSGGNCEASNEFIYNAVMLVQPKVLFIGSRWEGYVKSDKLDAKSEMPLRMKEHFETLSLNFSRVVSKVVFIGTTPSYAAFRKHKHCRHLQGTIFKDLVSNVEAKKRTYASQPRFWKTNVLMRRYFESTEAPKNAEFLDIFQIACQNTKNVCNFDVARDVSVPSEVQGEKDRLALWDDGVHLSLWGSWAVGMHLHRVLQ